MTSWTLGRIMICALILGFTYVGVAWLLVVMTSSAWPLFALLPAVWITALIGGGYWGLKNRARVKALIAQG
ncbi:MAG TPA: hypothetical protein VH951_05585, partial [Dehalococcoidia bacterium]